MLPPSSLATTIRRSGDGSPGPMIRPVGVVHRSDVAQQRVGRPFGGERDADRRGDAAVDPGEAPIGVDGRRCGRDPSQVQIADRAGRTDEQDVALVEGRPQPRGQHRPTEFRLARQQLIELGDATRRRPPARHRARPDPRPRRRRPRRPRSMPPVRGRSSPASELTMINSRSRRASSRATGRDSVGWPKTTIRSIPSARLDAASSRWVPSAARPRRALLDGSASKRDAGGLGECSDRAADGPAGSRRR